MGEFKPSELPANTTIDDAKEGYYTKNEFGRWEPAIYHCADCAEDYEVKDADADEKFKDFKIIALPYSVVEQLASEIVEMTDIEWQGTVPNSIDIVIKEAVDTVMTTKPTDDTWMHLSSFEPFYVEINEKGEVRTDWDGKIYKPEYDIDLNVWLTTFLDPDGEENPIDPFYFVRQQFNKDLEL